MNKTEQLELDKQEKTKVKEKKAKSSKLNIDDSFLFYTNNNNLRTYLTNDTATTEIGRASCRERV